MSDSKKPSAQEKYGNGVLFHSHFECRCGWGGFRGDMRPVDEIERYHPANEGKCSMAPDLHVTHFEDCPKCGRSFFADDRLIQEQHYSKNPQA